MMARERWLKEKWGERGKRRKSIAVEVREVDSHTWMWGMFPISVRKLLKV